MTQGFDEWYNDSKTEDFPNLCDAFKAGQQSKQAEVDELRKRIEDLKAFCIKGVESNMLSIEYNQALIDMYKILKGDQS